MRGGAPPQGVSSAALTHSPGTPQRHAPFAVWIPGNPRGKCGIIPVHGRCPGRSVAWKRRGRAARLTRSRQGAPPPGGRRLQKQHPHSPPPPSPTHISSQKYFIYNIIQHFQDPKNTEILFFFLTLHSSLFKKFFLISVIG